MKDKEIIEEMAKVIRPILENRTDICFIPDLDKPIAEELLKHYKLKLPKDSVVLSREEYEKLKLELAIEKKRADESYTQKEVEEIVASKERIKGKEMVREIFAKEREFIYSKWKSYITMNDLIELAKQFGVEIKE